MVFFCGAEKYPLPLPLPLYSPASAGILVTSKFGCSRPSPVATVGLQFTCVCWGGGGQKVLHLMKLVRMVGGEGKGAEVLQLIMYA